MKKNVEEMLKDDCLENIEFINRDFNWDVQYIAPTPEDGHIHIIIDKLGINFITHSWEETYGVLEGISSMMWLKKHKWGALLKRIRYYVDKIRK